MKEMTFMDHLDELRTRLIIIAIVVLVGSFGCFFISRPVLEFIRQLTDVKLQVLTPTVPFIVLIKVSVVLGIAVTSPITFSQVWLFVSPGLFPHEKKYALPVVASAVLLFLIGGAFALLLIPYSLDFLESFGGGIVDFHYTLDTFVSFILNFILAFGLLFQLPLVLLFLAKIGIVNYKMLAGNRSYAIVIALTVGAIFTPADPLSMFMLAVPLYLLFEVSLILVRFTKPRDRAKLKE